MHVVFLATSGRYWRQRAVQRLGDPPQGAPRSMVVRDRDGRPQQDPLAVHCFSVCTRNALLRDLLPAGLR